MYPTRSDLIQFCRLMFDRHYLISTDGNVSARLQGGFLVTPSGRNKGLLVESDLVELDASHVPKNPSQKPSSEFLMHRVFYEERADIYAVLHCHPTWATVFACTDWELDDCLMTESVVGLGSVPKAKIAIPSTSGLSEGIRPLIRSANAVLLANHGLVVGGSNLEDAFNRLETVEHFARISYLARMSGSPSLIDKKTVRMLEDLRDGYGMKGPFINCKPCATAKNSEELDKEEIKRRIVESILQKMR